MSPVVAIGKEGITPANAEEITNALATHELIKVRVLDTAPLERKTAVNAIADAVAAHPVGMIGRIAILYRPREKDPEIKLSEVPKRRAVSRP